MTKEQVLIDKIHAEFDSAQERLLKDAMEILNNTRMPTKDEQLEKIAGRLSSLGFTNVPAIKKAEQLAVERSKVHSTIKTTNDQASLVAYYMRTYPFLKFLTEGELDRICTKYKLIYAPIESYTKDVPERNITDIESAQGLRPIDSAQNEYHVTFGRWYNDHVDLQNYLKRRPLVFKATRNVTRIDDFTTSEWLEALSLYGEYKGKTVEAYSLQRHQEPKIRVVNKQVLFIAAPKSHFNLKGMHHMGLGYFTSIVLPEPKDPIVFRYVKGGIQVLTKWGLEANDPALVVPQLN